MQLGQVVERSCSGFASDRSGRATAFGAIVATAANAFGGNVPRGNRSMRYPYHAPLT